MSFIQIDDVKLVLREVKEASVVGGSRFFWVSKRLFDIVFSLCLLPVVVLCSLILLLLNPVWNKGPLFYMQTRMGERCRAFKTIKFRTMEPAKVERGPDDPIETHRITPLGAFLRKSRIDELPQVLNVLRGEMSLIGPRPDYFTHAKAYLRSIPEYRARHMVKPGISGLAQVELGYVEGIDATRAKALADLRYIQNAGFRLEWRIFWATISTVIGRRGA